MKSNKKIGVFAIISTMILSSLMLSGCIQENKNNGSIEPDIILIPSVNFDATILSLSLSDQTTGRGPTDTGVVVITKINSIINPDEQSIEGLEENKNISAEFIYSTRPAKIIRDWILISGDDSGATTVSSSFTFSIENEIFVYRQTSETTIPKEDIIIELPGLSVDSNFTATGSFINGKIQVDEYEVRA